MLVLILIADSLEHEREQDYHPEPVCSAEACAVEEWEGGEEGSAECHERCERQLPLPSCGVDYHTALCIVGSDRQLGVCSLDKHHEDEQGSKYRYEQPPVMLKKFVCHSLFDAKGLWC